MKIKSFNYLSKKGLTHRKVAVFGETDLYIEGIDLNYCNDPEFESYIKTVEFGPDGKIKDIDKPQILGYMKNFRRFLKINIQ